MVAIDSQKTVNTIAEEMGVTEKTVRRDISELKQKGLLTREGGTRGRWVLTLDTKSL